ncbi:MAG: hypothetical protein GF388_11750, partial [Candidatus Aegiribacteria sp.]|nr:hypothetical protein [Candidatus Aegiribacteria sp.]MBD3295650.1 hypothetical protein [Candidatus Fermentibacteria bacterium]
MKENHPDIIAALATPEGSSALAVVRISGRGSIGMVERMMGLKRGRLSGTRRKVGAIGKGVEEIDQVVALSWPEGRSYTGEEMVELICHGVQDRVSALMEALRNNGARFAEPGEFTSRAFASGRMSAIDVMELSSLWDPNSGAEKVAEELRNECEMMLKELEGARELLDGDIEFGELHEDAFERTEDMRRRMRGLSNVSEDFSKTAEQMEQPLEVIIMGPANSGKSTLFNILAGSEKALVSNKPGTTREGMEKTVFLNGRRVLLRDSAGTDGSQLDREALSNVLDGMKGNETVIWLSFKGEKEPEEELLEAAGRIIRTSSKSDLHSEKQHILRISSVTGEGLEELKLRIVRTPGHLS